MGPWQKAGLRLPCLDGAQHQDKAVAQNHFISIPLARASGTVTPFGAGTGAPSFSDVQMPRASSLPVTTHFFLTEALIFKEALLGAEVLIPAEAPSRCRRAFPISAAGDRGGEWPGPVAQGLGLPRANEQCSACTRDQAGTEREGGDKAWSLERASCAACGLWAGGTEVSPALQSAWGAWEALAES